MFDAIGQLFQGVIDFLTPILIPDWRALIDLLPVFLLIGVVGPICSACSCSAGSCTSSASRARASRTSTRSRGRRRSSTAQPVYPPGEPYCAFDRLVFPPGATRCAECGRDLAVDLPEVRHRPARRWIDTCGTCGLVLRIDRTVPALRPAGPPPGGAAAA